MQRVRTAPSQMELLVLRSIAEATGVTKPTSPSPIIGFYTEKGLNEALLKLEIRGLILITKSEFQLTEFGKFLVNLL